MTKRVRQLRAAHAECALGLGPLPRLPEATFMVDALTRLPEAEPKKESVCAADCIVDLPQLELSLNEGLLTQWEQLMEADSTASFFQTPAWCLTWYRIYRESFRPLVIVVRRDTALVGIVPLAVEEESGRLAFAGDNFSDYRDVVAAPGFRECVVAEVLRAYAASSSPGPLFLGPTQPESETIPIVCSLARRSRKLWAVARSYSGWRLWLGGDPSLPKQFEKKVARHKVNRFLREGPLHLNWIRTGPDWDRVQEEFYAQHSLRQLQAGRQVVFDSPRKRAFHDSLFRQYPDSIHVTVLWWKDRLLAGHYGYVWRNVLYWGIPFHDIVEDKHSPGHIFLSRLIQSEAMSQLEGLDLTFGTADFKARFSNSQVAMPVVEVYRRAHQYYRRAVWDSVLRRTKSLVVRHAGTRAWKAMVSLGISALKGLRQAAGTGASLTLGGVTRYGAQFVRRRLAPLHFTVSDGASGVHDWDDLPAMEGCAFQMGELRDLLKWKGRSAEVERAIVRTVREAPGRLRNGYTLHTAVVNGGLAAWGWASWPKADELPRQLVKQIPSSGKVVAVHELYILPEHRRGAMALQLLAQIVRRARSEGADLIYLAGSSAIVQAGASLRLAGFQKVPSSLFRRPTWRKRLKETG